MADVEETVEPKQFCVDCLDYLCSGCAREHRKQKLSRGHKMLEESALPKDVKLFVEMKKLSYCPIHGDVELDQYCPSHDALICQYCLKDDHRLCENLIDLTSLLKEKSAVNPGELIIELQAKCKAQHTELVSLSEAFQINKNEVEQDMHSFIKTLRDSTDNIEQTLNERLESLISPLTHSIRHAEKMLSNIEQKVSLYENLLAVTAKCGTEKQNTVLQFIMAMFMKKMEADDSLKINAATNLTFIHPVTIKDMLIMLCQCDVVLTCKEEKASELCSDEALDEEQLEFTYPKTPNVAIQVEESLVVCNSTSTKELDKMQIMYDNIRLFKSNRRVLALDILTDSRILVLHTHEILLYSSKLTLISTFQLQNSSNGLCIVDENSDGNFTVAVCFNRINKIMCLQHDSEFREKCDITCSQCVVSMSMYINHLAVLLQSGGLQLLDISTGHVCYAYEDFREGRNGSQLSICNPIRICTCKTTKQLILVDQKTVYCFKIEDGKCDKDTSYLVAPCKWIYEPMSYSPEISDARDVKCDSHGNTYVVNKSAVYQIQNAHKARILI